MGEILKFLAALILSLSMVFAHDVIKADSVGFGVVVKEKYGPAITDSCTVLMVHNGCFVVVRRNSTAWYPMANYSVSVEEK